MQHKMGITCQHVLVPEDGRWNGIALGIINLHDGLGSLAEELRVVELMTTVFLPVKDETSIAQRKMAVGFPC